MWVASIACVFLALSGCGSDTRSGTTGEALEGEAAERSPSQEETGARDAVDEMAAMIASLDERGTSRDAKLGTLASLQEDLTLPRHPSDGGGRAWLATPEGERAETSPKLTAGERARLDFVYEAGPLGIQDGGTLFFSLSPFWGWDEPQTADPRASGYTEVSTAAEGVELRPEWLGSEILAIEIAGRKLEAGERVHVAYGAGEVGAKIDRFAERRSPIWFSVDGDGDGVRKLIDENPSVDIGPGRAARLVVTLPATARPGERVRVNVSVLDGRGSSGVPFVGEVTLVAQDGLALPARAVFALEDRGTQHVMATASKPGVYRVEAGPITIPHNWGDDELSATSSPLLVEAGVPRVRWADLHGHSLLSDGTGTPDDYFSYARNVAGLDVSALTDHDHWGMRFLDATPEMWRQIRDATQRHHAPGAFVTLLGYEWTSWVHGHRHVLYFTDEGEVLSTLDPRYESPAQLWDALRGKPALTFAHHSAGGPISTNWGFPPDPELEPVTEIVSVHGSSEARDSPGLIYNPQPGNFVRDVLDAGYRLGFIGSGDSHDGHPGMAHLASPQAAGLAAIFSEELSREAILEALRARRTYATNGARIYLDVRIDGHDMGRTIGGAADGDTPASQTLTIRVVAESSLERVDLIRAGHVATVSLDGESEWRHEREIPPLRAGEYHYVRVVQADGGAAWSSPIFAGLPAPPAGSATDP